MKNFLPDTRQPMGNGWPARGVVLVGSLALALGVSHLITTPGSDLDGRYSGRLGSVAHRLADTVSAAFTGSTIAIPAGDGSAGLSVPPRGAGLPAELSAGATSNVAAGLVRVVLPVGHLDDLFGPSEGPVVHPDISAGIDGLGERTGTGTRTVARIPGPDGVQIVTTFVRTPAGSGA